LRSVTTDAALETTNPVRSNQADATQTSFQVKNCVKVKRGATLESTTALNPINTPVETSQPEREEMVIE
jgi:hypothetical protein